MTVTIDKFGRVLIPKPLRDQLGLQAGAELSLDVHEGGDGALELRAIPGPGAPNGGLVRVGGRLVYDGRLTNLDVRSTLRDIYDDRARRHAGLDPDAR